MRVLVSLEAEDVSVFVSVHGCDVGVSVVGAGVLVYWGLWDYDGAVDVGVAAAVPDVLFSFEYLFDIAA